MNISIWVARTLCVLLSIFYMSSYSVMMAGELSWAGIWPGLIIGVILALVLIGIDLIFKRFSLRAFNTATLGLLFGFVMGFILVRIMEGVVHFTQLQEENELLDFIKITLYLFGIYLGLMMTLRASDELYLSLPFVRFSATGRRIRELILDASILADPRIIDLASSGLFDNQWILPRFIIKELYTQLEGADESLRSRARRSLEVIQKLQDMDSLNLRINETAFPDVEDLQQKLNRLARLLEANILTADINRIALGPSEGVLTINIHQISNALKPLMEAGQFLRVKIQRYGKEPRQGVGYLEDGTMVVVNGGGDFIGEEVSTHVLSVKHTTSGRMIFCNVAEEE